MPAPIRDRQARTPLGIGGAVDGAGKGEDGTPLETGTSKDETPIGTGTGVGGDRTPLGTGTGGAGIPLGAVGDRTPLGKRNRRRWRRNSPRSR